MPEKHPKQAKFPFFILGAPRSGTTMLRDILRMHPNLASPEETHFFRWAEPFGSPGYQQPVTNNPILKRHRALDGITEAEFASMLKASVSRFDLCERYMALYLERRKPSAKRWFDKTPQNVYGALLIASQSNARFVHIVRDPVQVVSSLRIGKLIKMADIVGASNYWNEAAGIMQGLRRAYPMRVHEVRYEDFVANPHAELQKLLSFVGEPYRAEDFAAVSTRRSLHDDNSVLTPVERTEVERLCLKWRAHYGYVETTAE